MIFHMGLAKHMNTYFRKSFPFQNSQIFLNMYFSYWAYIYLHFFILRQNSHLRMIKKGIVWMHRMVTWKYLSLIKCLFWMENSLRKYVLLLEMIQAFGDIFKNTFPQHRWLFWKPSKYFSVPAHIWISVVSICLLSFWMVVYKSKPISRLHGRSRKYC